MGEWGFSYEKQRNQQAIAVVGLLDGKREREKERERERERSVREKKNKSNGS